MNADSDISAFDVALDQTAAPEPQTQPELKLIYRLEETGAVFPDVPKAVEIIEQAFEAAGNERGADCVRRMVEMLKGTSAGEALQCVLTKSQSLREAADAAGVSHVAIFHQTNTIRKRLGLQED